MSDTIGLGTQPAQSLVDRICDEFEKDWRVNQPAEIEGIILSVPEHLRPTLLRELFVIEREYRATDGPPLLPAEACSRFRTLGPWAEDVIRGLLTTTGSWAEVSIGRRRGRNSSAFTSRTPNQPATIGGFRVIRVLGRGGMGVVYLADDPNAHREVAIKVMKPEYAANPAARGRFLREARSASAIEHDNVVPVYQVDQDGDIPYLVMPALKGETLEDRLTREPLPSFELIFKIGREIAEGLAAAHAKGLVHRDVKPANAWLDGDPASPDLKAQVRRAKVLDFGLARAVDGTDSVSVTGSVVGTPAYMAPEQAAGRGVDARADLFSLGTMLYRMVAGRPAFAGPSVSAVLTAIATHTPSPPIQLNPTVPPALSTLIMRMLEKDPSNRPASAREVADALTEIERGQPTSKPTRRWAVVLVVASLLLIGITAWRIVRAPEAIPTEKSPPPLTLQWAGFAQGERGGQWSDLQFKDGMVLCSGEQYRIAFSPSEDCFVYAIGVDRTGPALLFPNDQIQLSNRCRANTDFQIPDGDNWFTLDEAIGTETTYLIASRDRLPELEETLRTKNAVKLDGVVRAIEKRSAEQLLSRGQTIEPDRRTVSARLQNGTEVRQTMDATLGGDAVIKRIRFEHRAAPGK